MTKREASESLATALSEWRDAGGPVEAVVVAIRQLEESTQDDPPEPEIQPGELVRGWIGGGVFIGMFLRRSTNGRCGIDPGDGRECYVDRVERFFVPFDWERWPDVKWIVDFDNTARFPYEIAVCPWSLGEESASGFRVVRILQRPEGR